MSPELSSAATPVPKAARPSRRGALVALGIAAALLVAIALDTKVVTLGSDQDVRKQAFSAETYGNTEFPGIQTAIEGRAVEARTLFDAIAADKAAATAQYGIAGGSGPVFSVRLTGVAGAAKSGIYDVAVEGLPPELRVRVQTGPAINGTELRDATGAVSFGQFTNQIEYQNAGSALNNAMKAAVLAPIDTAALTGRTIDLVGAFRLVNPKSWLITPARMTVK